MTERSIRWRWAALAVGAFVLLMGVEVATEDDLEWFDLMGDALQTALVVASATGSRCSRPAFRQSGTRSRP